MNMIIDKNIKLLFLLAIALQILFLLGLVGYKQYAILTGEKIVLKTVPVDPRSLFQGDYARLNYEINRLDLNTLAVEGSFDLSGKYFRGGEKVYIELEKGDKYFTPKKVSRTKPKTGYFIKGRAGYSSGNSLSVVYGIETYFMPEGKAKDFENLVRGRQSVEVLVGVSVDAFGQGLINKIIIDGKEIDASDFREVSSTSKGMQELQVQMYQRDSKRQNDLRQIGQTMERCYADSNCGGGANKYLTSATMPQTIDVGNNSATISTLDPLGAPYGWINNIGADYGYCIFAQGEADENYFVMSASDGGSMTIKYQIEEPKTLEQCGVQKIMQNSNQDSVEAIQKSDPVASFEGYVFIDTNKDSKFDKGDILYNQIIIRLLKHLSINQSSILGNAQINKGYYKMPLLEVGTYSVSVDFVPGSGVGSIAPSGNCGNLISGGGMEIKGGEKITNCNWIVSFE